MLAKGIFRDCYVRSFLSTPHLCLKAKLQGKQWLVKRASSFRFLRCFKVGVREEGGME
jgi:hypothetical protein